MDRIGLDRERGGMHAKMVIGSFLRKLLLVFLAGTSVNTENSHWVAVALLEAVQMQHKSWSNLVRNSASLVPLCWCILFPFKCETS